MITTTFAVKERGVGRKDYSGAIEYATQPFVTPSMRQTRITISDVWTLPVTAFPGAWSLAVPMPQEDGSWDWYASSLVVNFFEFHVSIDTNNLVIIGLNRYASIDDYMTGIVAQAAPRIFSYGQADLIFSKGIPTQAGSLYGILVAGWTDTAVVEIMISATGIVTNITAPWME